MDGRWRGTSSLAPIEKTSSIAQVPASARQGTHWHKEASQVSASQLAPGTEALAVPLALNSTPSGPWQLCHQTHTQARRGPRRPNISKPIDLRRAAPALTNPGPSSTPQPVTSATKYPAGPTASGKSPRPLSFLNAVVHSSVQGTNTRGIRGVGAGQAPSRGYPAAGISCSMTSASPRDRIPIPRTPDGALTAAVAWVWCGSGRAWGGRPPSSLQIVGLRATMSGTWHLRAVCIQGCQGDGNDYATCSIPFRPAGNPVLESVATGTCCLQAQVHNLASRALISRSTTM